ncbi:hypothetical protein P154DRAFT_521148 [Amniculicola lignicola CBS 123094]|uniref:Azaphilone pigments biosynthesis cluster protein L N-terminal domain-containing protein n=1 Tax=Amniculicola lignicola CBS 123094 TaxID=1392246 RepID=A0A6A5WKZ3_9PLEO|nr:hypothetical protein P154DRAFT_521148 [Amniculicola lignicola CBS 123094]
MAEVFALACGVAQFVGFAGQAVEGISYLHKKIKNVKGAPKFVKKLSKEVLTLQNIFIQLSLVEQHVPQVSKPQYERTLDDCWAPLDALGESLLKLQLGTDDSDIKKAWKAVVASSKKSELEEILGQLERSKTTLLALLAGLNVQMTSSVTSQLSTHMATIEPSLQRIEASLSHVSVTSENTYMQTIRIGNNIAQSSEDIMRHMDDVAQHLREDIPRLVEEGLHQRLQSAGWPFPPGQENQQSVQFQEIKQSLEQNGERGPPDDIPNESLEERLDVTYRRLRETSMSVRKRTFCTSFPLPIGFLQTKISRTTLDTTATSKKIDGEVLQVEISLLPFQWLSCRGQIVSVNKRLSSVHGVTWKLNLRTHNIVSNTSMIFRACEKRDLSAIQTLFEYRKASPFDVDQDGLSLMHYVLRPDLSRGYLEANDISRMLSILKFLVNEGYDPSNYVSTFLESYRVWAAGYAFLENAHLTGEGEKRAAKLLHDMLKICLQHSASDPLADPKVLLQLWEHSLGGSTVPRLDSSYMFQENLSGLEELIFEFPDRIFSDLLLKRADGIIAGSDDMWKSLMQQNYEALSFLCRGGESSLKAKIFSNTRLQADHRLHENYSCFCPTNGNHLLSKAVHNSAYKDSSKKTPLRQHVRCVLVLLLENGENPNARCNCKTTWQWPTGGRSITDLAAAEGLVGVWASALEECGFDSTRILDEWRYEGVERLFEADEEPDGMMAPLRFVGNLLYTTVSSFV